MFAVVASLAVVAGCGDGAPTPDTDEPSAADAGARHTPPVPLPEPAPLGPKVFPLAAAPMLDGPGRDEWQRPAEVVAALEIRPGSRVADVGCGTGYFTLRMLEAVGRDGHVVAVDIQQGMLDLLARRLATGDRERVTLRCSAPAQPLEAGDALDLVFCANTLKEVPDADAARFVQSMADGLAPGGRLAVLDWLPRRMRFGPPLEHRITPERVRALAASAGLTRTRNLDLVPTHSFQVFTKPE